MKIVIDIIKDFRDCDIRMLNIENIQDRTAISQMAEEDQVKFDLGASLLKDVQSGKLFDAHWLPIGEGLLAVRKHVMKILCLTKASGGPYKSMFSRVCHQTPYADMPSSERSNLLYCLEHKHDLVEMRVAWSPSEMASINHPNTMAKKLREFLKPPIDRPQRNASPVAVLKDKNAELARTIEHLNEQLASVEHVGDPPSLLDDPPEDIATTIIDTVGIEKAKSIYECLKVLVT